MTDKDKVHGEGNYAASRQYNQATRKFAQSGNVARAARKAAPGSRQEAGEMKRAEDIGRSRSKGEDPEPDESGEDLDDEERIEREDEDDSRP